jgi:hypothetical protein
LSTTSPELTVEFLYDADCTSTESALARLREVVSQEGQQDRITMVLVASDDEAVALRFPGSPTIRVNGVDIDPAGADAHFGLTCRAYHLPDGRITPFPPADLIRDAVRNALHETQTNPART